MSSDTTQLAPVRRGGGSLGLGLLTVANAAVYLVAAALHLGVKIPLGPVTLGFPEPSPPATVVEGLIGAALAAAAVTLFVKGRAGRRFTWRAYVFALAGTLFGLTIVLLRGLGGPDVWVHGVMLAGLAGAFVVLLAARGSREDRA